MSKWLLLALIVTTTSAFAEDYCFGFLNSHPDRKDIPPAQAEEIQKGHLAHMGRMGQAGHLLVAGPILTPGGPRGIVIYRCTTLDQAREWTALDPAVQNKRLTLEVFRWRGPDGMGEPLATKVKADPATKYDMIHLPLIIFRKTDKWISGPPESLIAEHRRQAGELAKQRRLRAGGPFTDEQGNIGQAPGLSGLYVLAAMPLDEAKALVSQDPLVNGGYVRADVYEWLVAGSAIPNP